MKKPTYHLQNKSFLPKLLSYLLYTLTTSNSPYFFFYSATAAWGHTRLRPLREGKVAAILCESSRQSRSTRLLQCHTGDSCDLRSHLPYLEFKDIRYEFFFLIYILCGDQPLLPTVVRSKLVTKCVKRFSLLEYK